MPVVRRYAPSRADVLEDLLIWLDRRSGPRLQPLGAPDLSLSIDEERHRVAALAGEDLLVYLARRSARRRPGLAEAERLLGLGGRKTMPWGVYYPTAEHPALTGASARLERGGPPTRWTVWSHDGALDVPLSRLVARFGRYGGPQRRLVRTRDEGTRVVFRSFRARRLRLVEASFREDLYSPLDDHGGGGPDRATIEAALRDAGRGREGTVLTWDREARRYRAVAEEAVRCHAVAFGYALCGSDGPYGLWWLRKRTLYRP